MSILAARNCWAFLIALVAVAELAQVPAAAQVAPPAPVRQHVDDNGVDLFLGTFNVEAPSLSGGRGIDWKKINLGAGWGDNVVATLKESGGVAYVSLGTKTDRFTISGSTYVPTEGNGAKLTLSGTTYTYTMSDGTVIHFTKAYVGTYPYSNVSGNVTDIVRPSGDTLTFSYQTVYACVRSKPSGFGYLCLQRQNISRISSVSNSAGDQLYFHYLRDAFEYGGDFVPIEPYENFWNEWGNITGVSAPGGTQSMAEMMSGSTTYFRVTNALGQLAKYRMAGNRVVGITRTGGASEDVTIAYNTSGRVSGVTTPDGTTSYSYSDASGVRTVTVTNPESETMVYRFDIASNRLISVTNALSQTTTYKYDSDGRVTHIVPPEGTITSGTPTAGYTKLSYDARGNVTEVRRVAKAGSGLADVVTSAGFDATCASTAKCNKPNWTKDARGKQTDYSYNTATGNILTMTLPPPVSGGTRPKVTYTYAGVNGVQMVTGISTCSTGSTCAGTANEVKTTIAYDSLQRPTSVTTAAGNGSVTSTTGYAYDSAGNLLSVDGPLAGTGDKIFYRYDALQRRIGEIGPDPDGTGPRKRRAVRTTYDILGRATLIEVGTVTGTDDAAWSAFAPLQSVETEYDWADRPLVQRSKGGSTTYQVVQNSYDEAGRLICTALRMNSATWSSLPASACTIATTGSAGPDRITRNTYDSVGRVTKVETAVGTTAASNEATIAYTPNGKVSYVVDGESNRTTYIYDGHDRLSQTRYPHKTTTNTSSTSDYEQLGYDPAGNVTSRRLRDGQTITYAYDDLGRLITKNLPGTEPTITYGYDLLGHPTSVSRTGHSISLAYDALGRNTSQTGPVGTVAYQYDAASRRTRMTWPDGFYATYEYHTDGSIKAIRENGSTVLATYGYNAQGDPTGVTFANGTSQALAFDPIGRLSSLTSNLAGTSADNTRTFAYNSAGQITQTTQSNDVYAFDGLYNVDRAYTVNGLNQLTNAGGTALTYDARGNLTNSGADTFSYSSENFLTGVTSAASMVYDPLGRLWQVDDLTSGGPTTRFAYDGAAMIGEYNTSGTLLRRYVHGPGIDNPIVWYEGTGTTNRRFLHADERGSIIAVSNASGALLGANAYDEYGIPSSSNLGRFQYTGQVWLEEAGLYYYKARMYSPTLGRFLQIDPIGYSDGMNIYNYVGSDPVNKIDPMGLSSSDCNPTIEICVIAEPRPCLATICASGSDALDLLDRLREELGQEPNVVIVVSAGRSPQNDGPCPTTSAGDLATAVGHAETAHSAFEELADIENGGKYLRPIGIAGSAISSTATAVDSAARGETMDVTFARVVLPAIGGIAGGALGAAAGSLGGPLGTAAGGLAGGTAGAALGDYLADLYAADAPRPRGCR